jgi:hypothetical protein
MYIFWQSQLSAAVHILCMHSSGSVFSFLSFSSRTRHDFAQFIVSWSFSWNISISDAFRLTRTGGHKCRPDLIAIYCTWSIFQVVWNMLSRCRQSYSVWKTFSPEKMLFRESRRHLALLVLPSTGHIIHFMFDSIMSIGLRRVSSVMIKTSVGSLLTTSITYACQRRFCLTHSMTSLTFTLTFDRFFMACADILTRVSIPQRDGRSLDR